MKKTLLILTAILIFINVSIGQTTNQCDTIDLKTVQSIKDAGSCVLIAADYVLSKPLHTNDKLCDDYRKFIIVWMGKTPDYMFSVNAKIMAICKDVENVLLFGIYTTCLAKAAIDVKTNFEAEAIKLLVTYIKNPNNQVKQTSKVKKLIDDFDNNKIEKYIK